MTQARPNIILRPCTAEDIPSIGPVERSAATPFAQYPALADLANDSTSPEELAEWVHRMDAWEAGQTAGLWGWLYVACEGDSVVGFLAASQLDAAAHIEELSIAATHQRLGLGSRLMKQFLESVNREASASTQPVGRKLNGSLSLKTYVDVPWNKPWYEKFGFIETTPDELGEEHVQKNKHDPAEREGWRRCFMVRR